MPQLLPRAPVAPADLHAHFLPLSARTGPVSRGRSRTPRPPDAGFTLIEALVAVAVAAVLATVAWPALHALIDHRRLDQAATQLGGHLQLARSEAIARNTTVRFSLLEDTTGGRCYQVHTGPASDCRCDGGCALPGALLHAVALPAAKALRLDGPTRSLNFDPQLGTSTPAATFRLTGRDGRAVHHVVNLLGRVRTCSPNRSVPGHADC